MYKASISMARKVPAGKRGDKVGGRRCLAGREQSLAGKRKQEARERRGRPRYSSREENSFPKGDSPRGDRLGGRIARGKGNVMSHCLE